jgi:F-box and WD-40 domain protein 1/11
MTLGPTWDVDMIDIGAKAKRILGLSASTAISSNTPLTKAPLQLDWRILYRDRLELDLRWSGATDGPIFRDNFFSAGSKNLGAHRGNWEPKLTRISGHFDR